MKNTLTIIYRYMIRNWILAAILILAAALRLWQLGSIPPSLTQDEAALGYNAYSILRTGRDEYGKFLPIIFKSFGDYKPGLYVYLDVPFVATFGLSGVSTRLPSVVAGILSIYLIYLISNKLFPNRLVIWNLDFGIFAALIAAVNPWLIYYSRGAWETNVSLMLALAGIYFFLRALQDSRFLILASASFAMTLLTYQGAKLSSLIVVLLLVLIYRKDIAKIGKKYIFGSVLSGIIISLPIILSFFTGQSGRLKVFSVFSYPRPAQYTQAFLDEGREKIGDLNYFLFHSESLNFTRGIFGRWSNYFSGKFLFFEGDYQNPQHSPPYQGMLLITDVVLLIWGMVALFGKRLDKSGLFAVSWLLLSPLPAVLARDQINAVRAMNMAGPLIIISALGLNSVLTWIGHKKFSALYYFLIFTFYILAFSYFLDAYFVHLPKHDSRYWNYGYREAVLYISKIQLNYKTIKFPQSYSQPYIYFLFYQKYDPAKYQQQANLIGGTNSRDVGFVEKLDNIEFTNVNWASDRFDHQTLLIGDPIALPEDIGLIHEIKYMDSRETAFKIIEVK